MFTTQFIKTSLGFINKLQYGLVTLSPEVKYCTVDFNLEYYDDRLFGGLAIQLPSMLKQASIKRKAEYLAARYAAKEIFSIANCNHIPGTAMDRSPIWPAGWCGSLTHSCNTALALVASDSIGVVPGVDMEFFLTKKKVLDIANLLAREEELTLIKNINMDYETGLYLLFSIKESLFKSIYPAVKCFGDFKDVRVISIDTIEKKIVLELTKTFSSYYVEGFRIMGNYFIDIKKVITLVL